MINCGDIKLRSLRSIPYHYIRKSVNSFRQNTVHRLQNNFLPKNTQSFLTHTLHNNSYTFRTLNNSYDAPINPQKSYQISSPNKHKTSQQSAKNFRDKKITFTYSSPGSNILFNPMKRARDVSPTQRLTQSYKQVNHHHSSQTYNVMGKQKQFESKFPHATLSTLVSLKDTKSRDMNIFDVTIEEEQSESNNKGSSKGKQSIVSNIESELQNLFLSEKQQIKNNEEEFILREHEFEEVLFS